MSVTNLSPGELETLVVRAEAGDARAAHTLLKAFSAEDPQRALIAYMQRCCHRISQGEKPATALNLKRPAGAPQVVRRDELARRVAICLEILHEIKGLSGQGKVGRAQDAVHQRLKLSPRAVRSAWEDQNARLVAKTHLVIKREGLGLTDEDRLILGS